MNDFAGCEKSSRPLLRPHRAHELYPTLSAVARLHVHVRSHVSVPAHVCVHVARSAASVLRTESAFSACELASIATSATQPARRAAKSMNGALLVQAKNGGRPHAKSGYGGHAGMLTGANNGMLPW